MVKRIVAFLLIISLITGFQPNKTSYADNTYTIMSFGDEPVGNYGVIGSPVTFSKYFEWWHYSGGYWKCTALTRNINDGENKYWYDPNYIADHEGLSCDWVLDVPQEVQHYIHNGGKVTACINVNSSILAVQKLFNDTPTYYINDNKIYVHATPHFVCLKSPKFQDTIDGLQKYIPLVDQAYGRNVYSIFDKKTNAHLGMAYSTQSAESYKIPLELIKDSNGDLYPGTNIHISDANGKTLTRDSGTIKIGLGTFAEAGAVGLTFSFPLEIKFYKMDAPPPDNQEGDSSSSSDPQSDMIPNPTAVIKADDRGNEKFDVTKGVPTSEDLYSNVFAKNFLYRYTPTKHIGTKVYNITIQRTYHLSWTVTHSGTSTFWHVSPLDPNMDRDTNSDGIVDFCPGHTTSYNYTTTETSTQTVSKPYLVTRTYTYYTVDNLDIYSVSKAVINNYALPGGSVTLTPQGYIAPTMNASHKPNDSDHITDPSYDAIKVISDENVNSSSVPNEDLSSYANAAVGDIKVKNDKLIVNSTTVLDDAYYANIAPDPANFPARSTIGKDVLYKKDLKIDDIKLNKVNESTGTIYYDKISTSIPSTGESEFSQPINNINQVLTHTPVVCNAGISNDKKYNQMLNSDNNKASLILDMPSKLQLPTDGQHLDIKGYGDKDYADYTKDKQVRFPFDVYIDTTFNESGKYLKAGTWHSIPIDKEIVNFYIPSWVDEGNYDIDFREVAINAPDMDNTEENANLNINNYIATDTIPVQVSGRLYGFKITDISDYPLWENVFRTGTNTSNHTNNYFRVGTKDQNGDPISPSFTLPLLDGSHPQYKNRGALKTGVSFKFDLYSIGNYFGEKDCIQINPTFWYIKKDGSGKQQVDLYYNEKFNGKENYFVKAGSSQDHQNTHYIKLGDQYRNVPDLEITNTSNVLGIDKNIFSKQDAKLGWYDGLVLSKPLRTFAGNVSNLPAGVAWKDAVSSKQHWFGEYWLPDKSCFAPKGYNVADYGRTHQGLDGKESFWLKDGYIIVNFNISTIKNADFDNPVLSYFNSPFCNMWEMEGFNYTNASFSLVNGDTAFYYADKRSSDDYQSGGTH